MDTGGLSVLVLVWIVSKVGGWTSPPRDIIQHGEILQQQMLNYIEQEELRLQRVRSLADGIRSKVKTGPPKTEATEQSVVRGIHSPSNSSTDIYLAHPLNALQTIKAWRDLREIITRGQRENYNAAYRTLIKHGVRLPQKLEATTLYRNVIILQKIHGIPVSHIVQGNILDCQALSVDDLGLIDSDTMLDIADTAREFGETWLAADWTAHSLFYADKPDGRLDKKVDYLMSSTQKLIQEKVISNTASLELERWIYVYDRDASSLQSIAAETLEAVAWLPEKSTMTGAFAQYSSCRNTASTPPDIFQMKDVCSSEDIDLIMSLGRILNRMSFELEGLSTRVRHSVLSTGHWVVINAVLDSVLKSAAAICEECSQFMKKAIDDTSFSFKIKYDSAVATGFQYKVEEDDFAAALTKTTKLLDVILFASADAVGNVVPFPGSQAVIPMKNVAYIWRSEGYNSNNIQFCPVLFGERWSVHITFAEL